MEKREGTGGGFGEVWREGEGGREREGGRGSEGEGGREGGREGREGGRERGGRETEHPRFAAAMYSRKGALDYFEIILVIVAFMRIGMV
jgi:hypothetical protein